jgi:hypothetical protein
MADVPAGNKLNSDRFFMKIKSLASIPRESETGKPWTLLGIIYGEADG